MKMSNRKSTATPTIKVESRSRTSSPTSKNVLLHNETDKLEMGSNHSSISSPSSKVSNPANQESTTDALTPATTNKDSGGAGVSSKPLTNDAKRILRNSPLPIMSSPTTMAAAANHHKKLDESEVTNSESEDACSVASAPGVIINIPTRPKKRGRPPKHEEDPHLAALRAADKDSSRITRKLAAEKLALKTRITRNRRNSITTPNRPDTPPIRAKRSSLSATAASIRKSISSNLTGTVAELTGKRKRSVDEKPSSSSINSIESDTKCIKVETKDDSEMTEDELSQSTSQTTNLSSNLSSNLTEDTAALQIKEELCDSDDGANTIKPDPSEVAVTTIVTVPASRGRGRWGPRKSTTNLTVSPNTRATRKTKKSDSQLPITSQSPSSSISISSRKRRGTLINSRKNHHLDEDSKDSCSGSYLDEEGGSNPIKIKTETNPENLEDIEPEAEPEPDLHLEAEQENDQDDHDQDHDHEQEHEQDDDLELNEAQEDALLRDDEKPDEEDVDIDDDHEDHRLSPNINQSKSIEPLIVDTTNSANPVTSAVTVIKNETEATTSAEAASSNSSGVSDKAPSLSPEMVCESLSEISVKRFYNKPQFMENNLGIEEDPKLGEIVQKVSNSNKETSTSVSVSASLTSSTSSSVTLCKASKALKNEESDHLDCNDAEETLSDSLKEGDLTLEESTEDPNSNKSDEFLTLADDDSNDSHNQQNHNHDENDIDVDVDDENENENVDIDDDADCDHEETTDNLSPLIVEEDEENSNEHLITESNSNNDLLDVDLDEDLINEEKLLNDTDIDVDPEHEHDHDAVEEANEDADADPDEIDEDDDVTVGESETISMDNNPSINDEAIDEDDVEDLVDTVEIPEGGEELDQENEQEQENDENENLNQDQNQEDMDILENENLQELNVMNANDIDGDDNINESEFEFHLHDSNKDDSNNDDDVGETVNQDHDGVGDDVDDEKTTNDCDNNEAKLAINLLNINKELSDQDTLNDDNNIINNNHNDADEDDGDGDVDMDDNEMKMNKITSSLSSPQQDSLQDSNNDFNDELNLNRNDLPVSLQMEEIFPIVDEEKGQNDLLEIDNLSNDDVLSRIDAELKKIGERLKEKPIADDSSEISSKAKENETSTSTHVVTVDETTIVEENKENIINPLKSKNDVHTDVDKETTDKDKENETSNVELSSTHSTDDIKIKHENNDESLEKPSKSSTNSSPLDVQLNLDAKENLEKLQTEEKKTLDENDKKEAIISDSDANPLTNSSKSWVKLEEIDEETLKHKEQLLINLGLCTLQVAAQRREIAQANVANRAAMAAAAAAAAAASSSSSSTATHSTKRNGKASATTAVASTSHEYTGTLKTVIKLNRNSTGSSTTSSTSNANPTTSGPITSSAITRKNQNNSNKNSSANSASSLHSANHSDHGGGMRRQSLKITFQKGRARGSNNSEKTDQHANDDSYYTIQNENEGSSHNKTNSNSSKILHNNVVNNSYATTTNSSSTTCTTTTHGRKSYSRSNTTTSSHHSSHHYTTSNSASVDSSHSEAGSHDHHHNTMLTKKEEKEEILIPEKASSFKFHPGRLCEDQCYYCSGKFGLYDTPCHVGQIKSKERQQKILANEHLTVDNCLCDACFRHVDRRANAPSYKKRLSGPSHLEREISNDNSSMNKASDGGQNVPEYTPRKCLVPDCDQPSSHSLRRKCIRKSVKKFLLNFELPTGSPCIWLCQTHYDAVLQCSGCVLCKKRLGKNHMYHITSDTNRLEKALSDMGIPVQLGIGTAVCKLCRYFANLLMKPPDSSKSQKADFVKKYRKRLLHFYNINDESNEATEEEDDIVLANLANESHNNSSSSIIATTTASTTNSGSRTASSGTSSNKTGGQKRPMKRRASTRSGNVTPNKPIRSPSAASNSSLIVSATEDEIQNLSEATSPNSHSEAITHDNTKDIDAEMSNDFDAPIITDSNSSSSSRRASINNNDEKQLQQQAGSKLKAILQSVNNNVNNNNKKGGGGVDDGKDGNESSSSTTDISNVLRSNPNISMRELFPGEEDLGLNFKVPFSSNNNQRTPEGWTRVQTFLQYDEPTRRLWEDLQKPYGNQSSFLRHLILLEKYYRNGDLILSPNACSNASVYTQTVRQRLTSFDHGHQGGLVSSKPSNSPALLSKSPSRPNSSLSNKTFNNNTNTTNNNNNNNNNKEPEIPTYEIPEDDDDDDDVQMISKQIDTNSSNRRQSSSDGCNPPPNKRSRRDSSVDKIKKQLNTNSVTIIARPKESNSSNSTSSSTSIASAGGSTNTSLNKIIEASPQKNLSKDKDIPATLVSTATTCSTNSSSINCVTPPNSNSRSILKSNLLSINKAVDILPLNNNSKTSTNNIAASLVPISSVNNSKPSLISLSSTSSSSSSSSIGSLGVASSGGQHSGTAGETTKQQKILDVANKLLGDQLAAAAAAAVSASSSQQGSSLTAANSSQKTLNNQPAALLTSPPELISFNRSRPTTHSAGSSSSSSSSAAVAVAATAANLLNIKKSQLMQKANVNRNIPPNVVVLPDNLTPQERQQSKSWRPTLMPVEENQHLLNKSGPLYQTADGRRLPSLVQVQSGGKPFLISIFDYNRMCILRREKLLRDQMLKQGKSNRNNNNNGTGNNNPGISNNDTKNHHHHQQHQQQQQQQQQQQHHQQHQQHHHHNQQQHHQQQQSQKQNSSAAVMAATLQNLQRNLNASNKQQQQQHQQHQQHLQHQQQQQQHQQQQQQQHQQQQQQHQQQQQQQQQQQHHHQSHQQQNIAAQQLFQIQLMQQIQKQQNAAGMNKRLQNIAPKPPPQNNNNQSSSNSSSSSGNNNNNSSNNNPSAGGNSSNNYPPQMMPFITSPPNPNLPPPAGSWLWSNFPDSSQLLLNGGMNSTSGGNNGNGPSMLGNSSSTSASNSSGNSSKLPPPPLLPKPNTLHLSIAAANAAAAVAASSNNTKQVLLDNNLMSKIPKSLTVIPQHKLMANSLSGNNGGNSSNNGGNNSNNVHMHLKRD